jgi:pimeloyl-ACP methyl ester carboxylesterase
MSALRWSTVTTKRGASCRVLQGGEAGRDVVFFHGANGLAEEDPFLASLSSSHRVFAPELPGYGESSGEELLEDMLDFALHGWDVVDALGLARPHLVGHSMGAMIAAEMACVAPHDLTRLVLVAPAGLWIDAHPIADIFATLPHDMPGLLFCDPVRGAALLTGGLDFSDDDALVSFFVGNARRLGTAGKILFPIPDRMLSKRLYRLTADTLLVWGEADRLIPPVYATRWQGLIPQAQLVTVGAAGHMVPIEQPEVLCAAVRQFFSDPTPAEAGALRST